MCKSIVADLLKIFKSSVSAVLPRTLVRKSLQYCASTETLTILDKTFDLQNRNLYIVGAGKAVQYMALEVGQILGSKIKSGVVSIPIGSLTDKSTINNITFYEGAKNNLPDDNAVCTANKIKELATSLTADDFLLVLISGGGSALLSLPKPSISVGDKTDLIQRLANSGADIKELNTVRKRLSDLKGGQLAIKAYPAQVVSLILSDIVGDPLHLIASGPTTDDEDDTCKAMKVLTKYELQNHISKDIETILKSHPDHYNQFPKGNVDNFLIGSNTLSTEAAYSSSRCLKYESFIISNSVTGDVKDVAAKYVKLTKYFCDFIITKISLDDLRKALDNIGIPGVNSNIVCNFDLNAMRYHDLCLIFGGEITVKVDGSGKGGRNQHLPLVFSNLLHNIRDDFKDFNVYMLSAGTDGIDGPTDAAGAIGYLDLVADSEKDGFDVNCYIENNDSYNFFKSFRNGELHVITGHTNTNVMDIHLIIIQKINKIMK